VLPVAADEKYGTVGQKKFLFTFYFYIVTGHVNKLTLFKVKLQNNLKSVKMLLRVQHGRPILERKSSNIG